MPIVYITKNSVVLRHGTGAPQVIGTFVADAVRLTPVLASSADGKEVAWLAHSTLYLRATDGGPTRQWSCTDCGAIAFQGDQLVAEPVTAEGSESTAASAQLLVFPASGSAPTPESITGIPSQGIDTDFLVMGDIADGSLVVAYGSAGGSDDGGPQQLYLVDQAGHATPFETAPANGPISGKLSNFATDLSGSQVSFVTYQNEGVCGGHQVAYVLDSRTGSVTVPTAPSGGGPNGFWVEGLWFDSAGTAYASLIRNPTGCDASGNPIPAPTTQSSVIVCKLVAGQWVPTSGGEIQAAYASGGWNAREAGPFTGSAVALGNQFSLVISHGDTSVTVPDVLAFAWAP